MSAKQYGQMTRKARNLAKQLGFRCAAGFLRNREVPFEQAYQILFNRAPRMV